MKRGLLAAVTAVVALGYVGRLGLRVRPSPFPAFGGGQREPELKPLPQDLPPPVERFYRRVYGGPVPVIRSAVITGRARMRLGSITFPGRFRFTHDAGRGYRHYIEATLFGLPLMKVNETYLGGKARLELPFGVTEGQPKVDQGANLALWAESAFWLPALLATDPRVRWEPLGETDARLVVPSGEPEGEGEGLVARFDAETDLLRSLEAMRYKGPSGVEKIPWRCEALEWATVGGNILPAACAITWADEGESWAEFQTEDVIYNAEVGDLMGARAL